MTPTFISGLLAILLYSVLVVMAVLQLKKNEPQVNLLKIIGLSAFICQGAFLYCVIVSTGGQDLSIFNMLALTNWLAIAILLINSLKRNVTLMLLLVSGLAAASTAASLLFGNEVIWQLKGQWASILHILSAMVATGLIFLAALQALLVTFADRQLRKHPTQFPNYFPPLQSLESFLFSTAPARLCVNERVAGYRFLLFAGKHFGPTSTQEHLVELVVVNFCSVISWPPMARLARRYRSKVDAYRICPLIIRLLW